MTDEYADQAGQDVDDVTEAAVEADVVEAAAEEATGEAAVEADVVEAAAQEPVETAPDEPADPADERRAALAALNMEDYIFQIEVPQEEVTEIKGGQKKQVTRKKLPGYLFVRMDLTDESWSAVRNTPGVTGFVGQTSRPTPLSVDEVVAMIAPPKKKVVVAQKAVDFEVGESIQVTDGPFATL